MYIDRVLEVGKAANGFIISCIVPLKPDAKKTDKMMSCGVPCVDRQYICKDAKEVADIVEDLMPLLDTKFTSEDAFDQAFKEATSTAEDETKE